MAAAEVARTYDFGILARRWAATWLDTIFIVVLIFAPTFIPDQRVAGYTLAVSMWMAVAYYPVLECFYGKTLGKFFVGIVVVDIHGRLPRAFPALIRTLLRIVEVNPFLIGGLPAGIVAYFSRSNQRVGDMCANTYNILESDRSRIA